MPNVAKYADEILKLETLLNCKIPNMLPDPLFNDLSLCTNHICGKSIDLISPENMTESEKIALSALGRLAMIVLEHSQQQSVTQMASGLAHEINNPLSVIMMKSSLLKNYIEKKQGDSTPAKECVLKIIETARRITNIVSAFVDMKKADNTGSFLKFNLKDIIIESTHLCSEKATDNQVNINLNIEKNIIFEGRSIQISQCFVNLINNSIDAIADLPEKWIEIEALVIENNIEITFTDSGYGIKNPHTLKHLMEPFNTSKPAGKGTGLGLSITKSLIEAHHGKFCYDTTYPHTRFIIKLPLSHRKI